MESFSLQGNWVDLVIVAVLIYFLSVGWTVGFWSVLTDFLSLTVSILIALSVYQFAADFLRSNFSLSYALANAIGFLFTAVLVEGIIGYFLSRVVRKIPGRYWNNVWNKVLGILPATAEGLIVVGFVLTLLISLPISGRIKSEITDSQLGGPIITQAAVSEVAVNEIFGGVIEDSLTYLTVNPESQQSVPISVDKRELTVDETAETVMFNLVNDERKARGVDELKLRPELVPVARNHARDMWEREYFGHVSPEGADVGDRLVDNKVSFLFAGENLALAPTLQTAHTGLMNSEGHRANILEPDFRQLGIGVIDNGVYGKIFVQIFTD